MVYPKETTKRKEFKNILLELANPLEDSQLKNICNSLENLYEPGTPDEFRHFYSDIFAVLRKIKRESSDPGAIDIIGQNLETIRKNYYPKNYDSNDNLVDIREQLNKLYDHVSLDIARMSYSDSEDRKLSGNQEIMKIHSKVDAIQSKAIDSEKKLKCTEEKMNDLQKEYIAILGIFAAIVLAFTGGITFSTSVLNNIDSVSPYRLVFVALIIGLVLINILFALFYYLDRLVKGKQENEENEEKNIRPLWVTNVILLFLLIATVVAWHLGVVEHRNETIPNEMTSTLYMEINNRE